MSISSNIQGELNNQFENSNLLPQKLELQDFHLGFINLIKSLNITIMDSARNPKIVPIYSLNQELWAERKQHWMNMVNEKGEEISRPFIGVVRKAVKQGTSPLKRTIPVKKKFTFVKVPKFDGTQKGYDLIKIPQPTYVDVEYELRFVSSFLEDADIFYEQLIGNAYTSGQAYMIVNGYQIRTVMSDPSEEKKVDIIDERTFQVSVPITIYGKLVDPKQFEKVNTVNRVIIKISETRKT